MITLRKNLTEKERAKRLFKATLTAPGVSIQTDRLKMNVCRLHLNKCNNNMMRNRLPRTSILFFMIELQPPNENIYLKETSPPKNMTALYIYLEEGRHLGGNFVVRLWAKSSSQPPFVGSGRPLLGNAAIEETKKKWRSL